MAAVAVPGAVVGARPQRNNLNAQTFSNFAVVVPVSPLTIQLSSVTQQSNLNALYTTMILSVPVGGNPVFMGGPNVSATIGNGMQIAPGVPILLSLGNERMLYELMNPATQGYTCNVESIPFVVWDTSQIWFSAAVGQTMGVLLFSEVFT